MHVVQAAAADPWLREGPWADLGTGSGALALGLAQELAHASAGRCAAPLPLRSPARYASALL